MRRYRSTARAAGSYSRRHADPAPYSRRPVRAEPYDPSSARTSRRAPRPSSTGSSSGCASRRSPPTRRTPATCAGQRRVAGRDAAPRRLPDRRDLADRRACRRSSPSGPAPTPARADRPRLRPPRRAAGRPARSCGRTRRSSRPSRRRRQLHARGAADDKGNVALPPARHARPPGRDRPRRPRGAPQAAHRGRGGVRLAALRRAAARARGTGSPATSSSSATPACGRARRAHASCTGMRGLTDGQIDLHGPDVDLHSGSFGGAVPNPLHRAGRAARARCTTTTAASRSPASTTASSRSPTASAS